jgi:hypothetical protein
MAVNPAAWRAVASALESFGSEEGRSAARRPKPGHLRRVA